ncbi:hypothetical protein N431DRAFT_226866 [Stipitochalara longipes BDJ]|nr:hypothetical protein N431DRAFT_226866 [Stipitochalara longipes BDJ]
MVRFGFFQNLVFRKEKQEKHQSATHIALPADSETNSVKIQPSFPSFSKLPTELRLKIWNAAIEPRVIFMLPRIGTTVPTILQVCKESRAEGLPHYHILTYPSINCEVPGVGGRNNIDTWSKIYFNKSIDTVFYGESPDGSRDYDWDLPWAELPTTVLQVHHLAVSRESWNKLHSPGPAFCKVKDALEEALRHNSLKTITIVHTGYWEAVEINKQPEVLSGANVSLRLDPCGPSLEDSGLWLRDLHRLNIQEKAPELRFAKLERYALSKLDIDRISTVRRASFEDPFSQYRY